MKKKKCVFTMAWNEPVFFPIWLKYYSQHFECEDIYILHIIKPRKVEFDNWLPYQNGFKIIPFLDRNYCDFQVAVDLVQNTQRELLKKYESVLFVEIDEMVWHADGLKSYTDSWQGTLEAPTGYEIVHNMDEEASIDLSKPILDQRQWWYHSQLFTKPLLSKVPLDWCWGFHNCTQAPHPVGNPDLLMIHLHKMDYQVALQRNISRQSNEADSKATKTLLEFGDAGYQNFLSEHNLIQWWNLSVDDGKYVEKTRIPEYIKGF